MKLKVIFNLQQFSTVSNGFQQQHTGILFGRGTYASRFNNDVVAAKSFMEESTKTVDNQSSPATGESLPITTPPQVPANTFTKVDNNLTGIGFFTASSKRSRKAIEKTTVVVDQGLEHRISILPSAKYGLPITQDQDYWLALMKLVEEHRRRVGKITNPFVFTTAEVTKILGQAHSGKNYKAVEEWLAVMASTTIEGGAYNTVQKSWMTKRTHAVETTITVGKELPDGTIAAKNHIWFSQWQLDNINAGNLIAIELSTYTQLQNNISRNLVPHLQEWLYASQRDGRFEKQYEDVCQLLGIRAYRYHSEIDRNFGPSLNELTTHGYISKWAIEPMANGKNFKLVLWHGPKYHRDRQARLSKKPHPEILAAGDTAAARRPRQRRLNLAPVPDPQQTPPPVIIDYNVVAELEKRGVGGTDARKLLSTLKPGQPVLDQLEYADHLIAQKRGKIENPPGFYISLLQRDVPVPPSFETSQARKARQEAESAKRQAIQQEREAALADEAAEEAQLTTQFDNLAEPDRLALLSQAKAEQLAKTPKMAQWLATNPEASSFLMAGARKKLKEGWTPNRNPQPETSHQTINPPLRQTGSLQDLPPAAPAPIAATPDQAKPLPPERTVTASGACPRCAGQIVLYSDGTEQDCPCRQERKAAFRRELEAILKTPQLPPRG